MELRVRRTGPSVCVSVLLAYAEVCESPLLAERRTKYLGDGEVERAKRTNFSSARHDTLSDILILFVPRPES